MARTFPVCSVRQGRYEKITKVDFLLTVPSQMFRSSREKTSLCYIRFSIFGDESVRDLKRSEIDL